MNQAQKDRRNKWQKEWRRKHPQSELARAQNRERCKQYYSENKEIHKQKVTAYQKTHKKRFNELGRKRYRNNPVISKVQKVARVKRKYGLTLEQIEQMRLDQNNQCKTCKREFVKTPHVDHNHKTGEVRGLLCGPCNRALGLLQENIETLQNMISLLGSDIST